MNTLTPEDIQVLQGGLELAQLWIDEIPALVDEDFEDSTFDRWNESFNSFASLVQKLTAATKE